MLARRVLSRSFALLLLSVSFGPLTACAGRTVDVPASTPALDGGTEPAVDASVSTDSSTEAEALLDCASSPLDDARVVQEACGVFVAPFVLGGGDRAPGTRKEPLASLARALEVAHRDRLPRVFACAATFEEVLTLDARSDGVSIVGGLSCPPRPESRDGAWQVEKAGRTTVIAPLGAPDGQPTIDVRARVRDTVLEGLEIRARDAHGAGGASVAMRIVGGVKVVLRRSKLVAGGGGDGAEGLPGTSGADEPLTVIGPPGGPFAGGITGNRVCWNSRVTAGGNGGGFVRGEPTDGAPGSASSVIGGTPGTVAECLATEAPGGNGRAGDDGTAGAGARRLGILDANAVWGSEAGLPGTDGQPGAGGGGGAAAKLPGAGGYSGGGGGGGPGGCPGGGGGGGGGGGASLTLVIVGGVVRVEQSELVASAAGRGGRGGLGGARGPGLSGGNGWSPGCRGGKGGTSGAGGAGGGGAGGLSATVLADASASISFDAASSLTHGAAGSGGEPGGAGAGAGTPGAAETVFVPK